MNKSQAMKQRNAALKAAMYSKGIIILDNSKYQKPETGKATRNEIERKSIYHKTISSISGYVSDSKMSNFEKDFLRPSNRK
jgi:hypothetical protein